jgi:hypothetical protein
MQRIWLVGELMTNTLNKVDPQNRTQRRLKAEVGYKSSPPDFLTRGVAIVVDHGLTHGFKVFRGWKGIVDSRTHGEKM